MTALPFEGSRLSSRTCGESGGVTRRGQPCAIRMNLSAITGRCFQHDGARQEAARQRSAAVGDSDPRSKRPKGLPPRPVTIADAAAYASWMADAVLRGAIDPKQAREAAVCLREFRGATEKRMLEAQIKALRQELAEAKRTGGRSS
jgi:hypothetical protein